MQSNGLWYSKVHLQFFNAIKDNVKNVETVSFILIIPLYITFYEAIKHMAFKIYGGNIV